MRGFSASPRDPSSDRCAATFSRKGKRKGSNENYFASASSWPGSA
jgi:hypothetical protein